MRNFTSQELSPVSLASPGRTITADKGQYLREHPDNRVVFNANLCLEDGTKIWFGDLDLVRDSEDLRTLSACYGKPLLVLYELDGRFSNAGRPLVERAVARVEEAGIELFQGR